MSNPLPPGQPQKHRQDEERQNAIDLFQARHVVQEGLAHRHGENEQPGPAHARATEAQLSTIDTLDREPQRLIAGLIASLAERFPGFGKRSKTLLKGITDLDEGIGVLSSLLLGTSILGFLAAVVGYFLCYWLVVHFRRKDATMNELTEEMEEVGEELDE